MEEKKQKEELQSRREFFKQAAKKALPVIGAIALASTPIIANAAEKEPMGCTLVRVKTRVWVRVKLLVHIHVRVGAKETVLVRVMADVPVVVKESVFKVAKIRVTLSVQ